VDGKYLGIASFPISQHEGGEKEKLSGGQE